MLDWINANAGLLNLIFTMVVAISTVVYAVLTARLVSETEAMRKAQVDPQLSVHAEPSRVGLNFMNLRVRNVGAGAAYDVRLTVDKDFEWMRGKKLSSRGIFTHPIPFFAPGQEISTFLLNIIDHVRPNDDSLSHIGFAVKASYQNHAGQRFEESFTVDFEYLEGLIGLGEDPATGVVRHLDSITKALEGIASGHRRVHTVVHSQSDIAEENAALRQRIEARKPRPADSDERTG